MRKGRREARIRVTTKHEIPARGALAAAIEPGQLGE